jgi:hypothetical protein
MARNKSRAEQRKERTRLEMEFLSSVLADIDMGDIRLTAEKYQGATWRQFVDARHQAIWRAIETLDLTASTEERVETLMAESGLPPGEFDDNRGAVKDLYKKAEGPAWLEHELAAAGALAAVGGKAYLREVCEANPTSLSTDGLARRLEFGRKEG